MTFIRIYLHIGDRIDRKYNGIKNHYFAFKYESNAHKKETTSLLFITLINKAIRFIILVRVFRVQYYIHMYSKHTLSMRI